MKFLSRKEEILLLAIWKLQDNAYGVTIRDYIRERTGMSWMFGAIYSPLGRLVDNGYVESFESEPVPERGGRRKVLYRLTDYGKKALIELKEMNQALWLDIPQLSVKSSENESR